MPERMFNRMADDWQVPWKRNMFWIVIITITVYAATAYAGSIMADNGRASCERGNTARHILYSNAKARIVFDQAIYVAVSQGPNSERVRAAVRADQKQAQGSIDNELNLSPGTDEPWATDCEAAYPDPLPWP